MPYTVKNLSYASPTPMFIFNYAFDSGLGGDDPDFKEWGGPYSKANGGVTYEQGLIGGRSGDGLYLYNTQFNLTTFAGPNKIAPTNFEISVDLHVTKGKDAARYGIIFGAASKTFGRNGNTPTFDTESTYYKLGLRFPDANASIDNTPAFYQLERCNGTSFSCTKLIEKAPLPSGLAAGIWDTLTVRRQGSSITVLVNGTELQTVSDDTYTGALEFGIFIQSAGANNTTNPLEIIIDNYIVSQLP